MDFFSRVTPAYKSMTNKAQPAAPSGLSGLFGSLLGSSTPSYKTVGGQSAKAPVSSSFWSMFAVTPSYKTAHAAAVPPIVSDPLEAEADASGVDEDVCDPGPDHIVVL
ncbi:MAG: hypothetical protein ACTHU0_28730 [Kofleriaceae bacterium]